MKVVDTAACKIIRSECVGYSYYFIPSTTDTRGNKDVFAAHSYYYGVLHAIRASSLMSWFNYGNPIDPDVNT